jgi:hypothetical protein
LGRFFYFTMTPAPHECRTTARGIGEHAAADRIAGSASLQNAQAIAECPGVPPSGSLIGGLFFLGDSLKPHSGKVH